MQQAFLDINGVRSNVLTYGKWVEESWSNSENPEIILIIPGNPGVTGFYKMFMHTIHEKTGLPVWIVSHVGHEMPKNNAIDPIPPWKNNEKLYGLQGQIAHKVDFIDKYVPENAKLHLIGHSIGSYIILEMLKNEAINRRVVDIKLLFPTVEHMAETPNGKFMTKWIKPIVLIILVLSLIYTLLPQFLANFLMYLYRKITGVPRLHHRTLVNFINPNILEKVFAMAYEELDQVHERNDAIIRENLEKIQIVYGYRDGWAPTSYCDRIKAEIPGIKAEVSQFDHAFVLKQSRQVGNFISDMIKC